WLPESSGSLPALFGYAVVGCAVIATAVLIYRRPNVPVVPLAVVSTLVICFFAPHMHDRYFYVCDALTIVLAFVRPWYVPTAIGVQIGSLVAYAHYLDGQTFHGDTLRWAAVATAFGVAWAVWRFVYELRHEPRTGGPGPARPADRLTATGSAVVVP